MIKMDFELIQQLHMHCKTQKEISEITGYPIYAISIALRAMNYKGKSKMIDYDSIANPIVREFCRYNNLTLRNVAGIIHCSMEKAKSFLEGDREVRLSIRQIHNILTATGMTFEEIFGKDEEQLHNKLR